MSVFLVVVGHGGCLLTAWAYGVPFPFSLKPYFCWRRMKRMRHATCGFVDAERVGGSLMVDL